MADSNTTLAEKLADVRLFDNRDALRDGFKPPSLIGRDDCRDAVTSSLLAAYDGDAPPNVLLHGPHGTGKRACLDAVLADLAAADTEPVVATTVVNCTPLDSPADIDNHVGRNLTGLDAIAETGEKPLSEAVPSVNKRLDKSAVVVLVVLDGFTRLGSPQRTLDKLSTIAADVPHVQSSVLATSADPSAAEQYCADRNASIFDQDIRFEKYDYDDLHQILTHRSILAFQDTDIVDSDAGRPVVDGETVAPAVIDQIAAVVARRSGSADRALRLLSRAGREAEREAADCVAERHATTAIHEAEATRVTRLLRGETQHRQLVAFAIASLGRDERPQTTGRVRKRYWRLVQHGGREPVGSRQVSRYLTSLADCGFSEKRRMGNEHRHVVACASPAVAVDALADLIDDRAGFGPLDTIENYETILSVG
jgi:cell division control protein 6